MKPLPLFCAFIIFSLFSITLSAQWAQIGSDIDGEAANDRSGQSVSISSDGTRVAIGAHQNDGIGIQSGQVKVYDWFGGSWLQVGNDIDGATPNDYFGFSLELSADGNILVVGAPFCCGATIFPGEARVYECANGSWTQLGGDISGPAGSNNFGSSVTISSDGSRIAVGGSYNNGGFTGPGIVRVYDWDGANWTQTGNSIFGDGAEDLARHVSLSGDGLRVAIGAPLNDGPENNNGQVRVFELAGSTWTQLGNDIYGELGEKSGRSIDLDVMGDRIIIGASCGNCSEFVPAWHGQARVYDFDGNDWVQEGSDLVGKNGGDDFGAYVTISDDGNTIAVGAPIGIQGSGFPYSRLYRYENSDWTQLGFDILGEATGDESGVVALSGDGKIVAIGAPFNDNLNGSLAGHARVYQCTDTDGDGHCNIECGGDDCNDDNPDIFPGAIEICDGLDNNCDGQVDEGFVDLDQDGIPACGGDCNDNNENIYPGAEEICDGIDNNCDGMIDNLNAVFVNSQSAPFPIPVSSITSTISVNSSNPITDINVIDLDITHTWINDVSVKLLSPQGTEVILLSQLCSSQDNLFISFDDESINTHGSIPCPPTSGESFQPTGNLSNFYGEIPTGIWTLIVEDAFTFLDGGTLNSWSVEIVSNDCEETCVDNDSDGFDDYECGGTDCDDENPAINPDADEICDGLDNNCDGEIDEGFVDTDLDGDADCVDEDDDNDGCLDEEDENPLLASGDTDMDNIPDDCDTCPFDPDNDIDGDGVCGDLDNCPTGYNPDQLDNDLDGIGDACDNCVAVYNPFQEDLDEDNIGDACDACPDNPDHSDNDGDGFPDCLNCGNNKVLVCHVPPGNPCNEQQLCISENAADAHIVGGNGHGTCYLGACLMLYCNSYATSSPIEVSPIENQNNHLHHHEAGDMKTESIDDGEVSLMVYPNPSSGQVNALILNAEGEARLAIYDHLGRTVYSKNILSTSPKDLVTLDHLHTGVYFVSLESYGKKIISSWFVVSE